MAISATGLPGLDSPTSPNAGRKQWKKLVGPSRTSRDSLFYGHDELLYVRSGWRESYVRVALRDIIAVQALPTSKQLIYSICLGVLMIPLLFLALGSLINITSAAIGGNAVLLFQSVVFGLSPLLANMIALGYNMSAGRGVRVFLHTAVQRFELTNVGRQTRWEKFRGYLLEALPRSGNPSLSLEQVAAVWQKRRQALRTWQKAQQPRSELETPEAATTNAAPGPTSPAATESVG